MTRARYVRLCVTHVCLCVMHVCVCVTRARDACVSVCARECCVCVISSHGAACGLFFPSTSRGLALPESICFLKSLRVISLLAIAHHAGRVKFGRVSTLLRILWRNPLYILIYFFCILVYFNYKKKYLSILQVKKIWIFRL